MNTPRSSRSSDFGLVAWLEETRIALPLKGVECRFQVTGALASVELDQIYHQNIGRPLDCTYTFPVSAGAAVYRCELHINGRVIRAKVEEKGEAKRIFREQKAAGRRAAIVEVERENIFTLSLGNVQPEDVVVVRFAWFQMLDRSANGLRLLIPTCLGVRYIPGKPLLRSSSGRGVIDDTDEVPDASRITPPRIDALHPDSAYFSLEGRLSSTDVEGGTLSSPTHALYVRENEDEVKVELFDEATVPDRDLVITWREPKARQLAPLAWRWNEDTITYALLQLRAPEGVQVAEDFAQDVYFLVDRSGSMAGRKWRCTCEALPAFVRLLGAEDRVWITFFESGYRDFAEAPMPAPEMLADKRFLKMKALGAVGGTELAPAALHVLEQIARHSPDRPTSVVLITDGEVGNDEEIVHAFQGFPHVRVHTFGIDTAVNDAFLRALARQQRGSCWLQTPNDDIAGTIAALGHRLRRPVITDLEFGVGWQSAGNVLPDLYAEEVVSVIVRGDQALPLHLEGRLPSGETQALSIEFGTIDSEAVRLLWAKERIDTLLAADRQAEAIFVARQYNLVCKGAAFITWDEAEQVQVAEEEIIQPAMQTYDAADDISYGAYECCLAEPPEQDEISVDEPSTAVEWSIKTKSSVVALLVLIAANNEGHEFDDFRERAFQATCFSGEVGGMIFANYLDPAGRRARKESPQMSDITRVCWDLIVAGHRLYGLGMPLELVDELLVWPLESGTLDPARADQLSQEARSESAEPLFDDEKASRWWKFLEERVGKNSPAYAVALHCLPRVIVVQP